MAIKKGPGDSILDGYRSKGFAGRVGFGRRPAVVVVDFIVGFTDPESPLAGELDSQIEATCALLETARSRSLPVFFTTTVYDPDWSNGGLFVVKIPSLKILVHGSRWIEVDPRLERQPSEPIIEKQYASAFFGTSLASTLTARRDRHRHRDRMHHKRVRSRDRGRFAATRFPGHRASGVRR